MTVKVRRTGGLTVEEAAVTCSHRTAAPVVLITGEVVASVCETCLARLPASWGCEDCEYAEIATLGLPQPRRVMTMTCELHS